MSSHHLVEDEGLFVCIGCSMMWDQPRPLSRCAGISTFSCPSVDGPATHHFGPDGHCHNCGDVDRG